MQSSVVFAAVAVAFMMISGTDGWTLNSANSVGCPFPFTNGPDGCVHLQEVEEVIAASRHKRQAVSASLASPETKATTSVTTTSPATTTYRHACPRCAPGVFDVYPVWEDCTKLNYCLNGQNFLLDCKRFNATFFNPVTKACETTAQSNNICLFRSSAALLG